ncbi:hypothetical protein AA0113_g6140 [Alternaria arborescens]|uniref:Uncharacterized protein n=2 Tax=Alternaria sect. Alternaria TaxID=2499237 RepID=A0AB37W375_9PLEO|nr:hypothetical protein AA0115_g11184 [Alternaria tenuissima]RYN28359.1 hypothetical protein AA0112_g7426 [Alternaria arborescens]RYN93128.1 hypothetical protein AA0119_g9773 [Alternaria tenuissima]RYO09806.1 hypothetical protein AA0121_g10910 [Alternaria tenuissima]RYO63104.1 hypothetical protein AA0113_g6140 [Alternaria arborescens]
MRLRAGFPFQRRSSVCPMLNFPGYLPAPNGAYLKGGGSSHNAV